MNYKFLILLLNTILTKFFRFIISFEKLLINFFLKTQNRQEKISFVIMNICISFIFFYKFIKNSDNSSIHYIQQYQRFSCLKNYYQSCFLCLIIKLNKKINCFRHLNYHLSLFLLYYFSISIFVFNIKFNSFF